VAQVLHVKVVSSSERVGLIDPQTDQTIGQPVLTTASVVPIDRRVTDDGTFLYRPFTNVVEKWELRSLTLSATYALTGYGFLSPIAINDGDELYVSQSPGINVIGRDTMTSIATITIQVTDSNQWTFSDATTLWVPVRTGPSTLRSAVSVVDVASRTVTATYNMPDVGTSRARVAAYYSGNVYVGVDESTGKIHKVSASSGSVSATYTLPSNYNPSQIVFAGGYLFVAGLSNVNVYRIDPATMTLADTYTYSSSTATPPILTTDGTYVWISANDNTQAIRKVVGSTGAVTTLTQTGRASWVSGKYGSAGLAGWVVGSVGW
jgi:hypothetical protein